MNITPAQRRAIASVERLQGGIDATPATFRILVDREFVAVDQKTGVVTVTDKGRAAIAPKGN